MKKSHIFTGVLFVLGAILLIISQFVGFEKIGFWSVFGSIVLVAIMIKSIVTRFWAGVFVPPIFLFMIFKNPLNLPDISLWVLLGGAVLLSIGFHMLFSSKQYYINKWNNKNEKFATVTGESNDDNPVISAFATGCTRYIHSENLQSCTINSTASGVEVYLDQAKLCNNTANIYINAKASGVEIYIPKTWNIIENLDCKMGGIDYSGTRVQVENPPTVTFLGSVRAAGLEINFI